MAATTLVQHRRSAASSADTCLEREAKRVERRLVVGASRQRDPECLAPSVDLHLQHVFLGREVAVEGPHRDARLRGDLFDGDLGESSLLEQAEGDDLDLEVIVSERSALSCDSQRLVSSTR